MTPDHPIETLATVKKARGRPRKLFTLDQPKKPAHRPKKPWDGIREELHRRLVSCQALPTVNEEAGYLAEWAVGAGIRQNENDPPKQKRIAQRMTRRFTKDGFTGVAGYRETRSRYRIDAGLTD